MDKREYLRSLGFEVGERGRFSAEMQTALANADMTFDAPKTSKRDDGLPVYEAQVIVPDIPPQAAVRKARQLFGYTTEGFKVGFVTCRRCSYHMMYCDCKEGILAPSIVAVCEDPLVNVGG